MPRPEFSDEFASVATKSGEPDDDKLSQLILVTGCITVTTAVNADMSNNKNCNFQNDFFSIFPAKIEFNYIRHLYTE